MEDLIKFTTHAKVGDHESPRNSFVLSENEIQDKIGHIDRFMAAYNDLRRHIDNDPHTTAITQKHYVDDGVVVIRVERVRYDA